MCAVSTTRQRKGIICRARPIQRRVEFRSELVLLACLYSAYCVIDVLLHTGVVAPSGDRDGLPNVIPEAMSAGVVVVT